MQYVYKKRLIRFIIIVFDIIGNLFKNFFKILFLQRDRQKLNPIKNILVFKLDHIGDVLLATPTIYGIRHAFPETHITLIIGPWSEGIVSGNPNVDEIVTYKAYWHDRNPKRKINIKETIALIRRLRKKKYDISFDLRGELFTIMLMFVIGVPRRISYGWAGGRFLLTNEVKTSTNRHQVEIFLDSLKAIGINPPKPNIEIVLSEKDRSDAMRLLKNSGWNNKIKLIGVHVGAGYPSKMWELDKYAKLIEKVYALGYHCLLVGGEDDISNVYNIEKFLSFKPITMVGKTTIKQTAALIEKCILFVGNDSAPVHIASAVGIPTIVIFSGANDWKRWRPFGENVTVITKEVSCAGCEKSVCDNMLCIQQITVEDILDNINNIIGSFKKAVIDPEIWTKE